MTEPLAWGYDFGWNRRDLAALIVLCILAAGLLVAIRGGQVELAEEIAVYPQRVAAAAETIDPNTASVASLRRLPGIGPEIARRIAAARPFDSPDELIKVKGIGPKKLRAIRPYLKGAR